MGIKNFPCEYQMDMMDCGPACLKIICKYYGKYYSLQYLRDLCGITKEGVSFLDLSYGAEKVGLHTLAIKADITILTKKIPLPCIVHWNENHFIVVYKITKNKIFVSDPATGLISYSHEQFVSKWCKLDNGLGAVLVIEPMADFNQRNEEESFEHKKSFNDILKYFRPYTRNLGTVAVIMLFAPYYKDYCLLYRKQLLM